MPEGTPDAPAQPVLPILRPRTGVAWAVIALVFLVVQALHLVPDGDTAGAEKLAIEVMRQQAQQQYGFSHLTESFNVPLPADSRIAVFEGFSGGPVAMRQRYAVLAGDILGPAAARDHLEAIEPALRAAERRMEDGEAAVQRSLLHLYDGTKSPQDPGVLAEGERAALRKDLGWFGDLALAPEGSPDRTAVLEPAWRLATRLFGLAVALLVLLGLGLAGAVLHWVLAGNGSVRFLFRPGAAPHGIYAETFAAWILLFIALQVGVGTLFALLAPGSGILLPGALSFLASLAALRWPVHRGVPWARVRADIGLFLSPTPVRDVLAGVACWAMAIPLMAAAFVVSLFLLFAQSTVAGPPDPLGVPAMPNHPVMGELSGGSAFLGILFVAAVCAPIVEETFFRGVLYRHLRDATASAGFSRVACVALSALASGLLFAAVHPQGWTFVPLLFAVAWGLVHAREWRGSLIAPMVAHGLHNAVVTTVAILTFGG